MELCERVDRLWNKHSALLRENEHFARAVGAMAIINKDVCSTHSVVSFKKNHTEAWNRLLKKLALNGCNVESLSEQTVGLESELEPISQTKNSLMKFLYNIHYSQYNEVDAAKEWGSKVALAGLCAGIAKIACNHAGSALEKACIILCGLEVMLWHIRYSTVASLHREF